LYNVGKDSRHLEFAEESIDFLSQEILAQKTEVEIFNPEKWWITSWPGQYGASSWWSFSNDIKEGEPNACSNLGWESCICICEKASPESCDSLGVCLENVKGFSFNHIQIDDVPLTLNLDYNGGVITKK